MHVGGLDERESDRDWEHGRGGEVSVVADGPAASALDRLQRRVGRRVAHPRRATDETTFRRPERTEVMGGSRLGAVASLQPPPDGRVARSLVGPHTAAGKVVSSA